MELKKFINRGKSGKLQWLLEKDAGGVFYKSLRALVYFKGH